MRHFLFDLGDSAEWFLGVGLLVWVLQYTLYAPWWTDPLGRSIVWLAASFEAVLVPSLVTLANPRSHFIGSSGYDYLEIANLTFAACVIAGRIWQFQLEHRRSIKPVPETREKDR